MRACLRIALALAVFGSLVPPTAVEAADQTLMRQTRVRSVGPTPHILVICYDDVGRRIACAHSARVAQQIAHYGACIDCPPVALPPSRYGRYGWWAW
jgi:hypothetical protein